MMKGTETVSTDFQNLNDDMVKLVAYAIVSVRRGHERILDGGEGTLLVIGKMTADSFTSFIIGRYLQKEVSDDKEAAINELITALDRYLRRRVEDDTCKFAQYLKGCLQEALADGQPDETRKKKFRQIPDEDRKFLRVHFVVSNRWSRSPKKFEEDQVAVLKEISQAIPGCDPGGS
jgi:hypothetical protein